MIEILYLLTSIVKALVDTPDSLTIEVKEFEDKYIFYITPVNGEAGQLLGKQGTLASCIRKIVKASANKYGLNKYVYVDIIDLKSSQF